MPLKACSPSGQRIYSVVANLFVKPCHSDPPCPRGVSDRICTLGCWNGDRGLRLQLCGNVTAKNQANFSLDPQPPHVSENPKL